MRQLIILFTVTATLFAAEVKLDSTTLTTKVPSDSSKVVVEPQKKRAYDYRYQIAGGVAMMLFFGLAIGTSESMNPR